MNEELLISLIESHAELYDYEDPHYHDDQVRAKIWEEIGVRLNEPPFACKEKWKKIRENFRKAIILRKVKGAERKFKPPRYAKELNFILPYLQYEIETPADMTQATSEDETIQPSPPTTPELQPVFIDASVPQTKTTKKHKKTDELIASQSFQSYVFQDEDAIVDFFTNLGQTVRHFPPDLRVRVKRSVFNIVSEAEEEILKRNNSTQLLVNLKTETQ